MPLEGADLEKAIDMGVSRGKLLTPEQRASNKAKLAELMANPEALAELMDGGKTRFEAADADGDGRLNLDEWNAYVEKETAHALE